MDANYIIQIIFNDLIKWFERQRYTLLGVFLYAFTGAYILYFGLSRKIPFSPEEGFISLLPQFITFPSGSIFLLILSTLFLVFFQRLKYPRTLSRKANIHFAIHDAHETQDSKKYLAKIYKELELEIAKCDSENIFHVAFLNQHLSKEIFKQQRRIREVGQKGIQIKWYNLLPVMPDILRTKYTLLVYGKLVAAQDGDEETYKIEPEYIVRHQPIPTHQSLTHSKRFKQYLDSQKWSFPKSKEMDALAIVPDNFRQHVLYAIGMSAHFSNLIKIALGIHKELLRIIEPKLGSAQYLRTLKSNVLTTAAMEARILAGFYSSEGDLDKAEQYYLEAVIFKPHDYHTNLNLAALYYTKDPAGTHKTQVYYYLNMARQHPADASFKLSEGFLRIFWENNVSDGIDTYIQALRKGKIDDATITGTYDWLCKREVENKDLIATLKGLIQYFKLDPNKGKETLANIKANIKVSGAHPVLLEKLGKILPG